MSARIAKALRTWGQAPRTPVKPAPSKPAHDGRVFIESPLGQGGAGVAISESDFARIDVFRTVADPAGYLRHTAYRGSECVEVIEMPAEQVRAARASLDEVQE